MNKMCRCKGLFLKILFIGFLFCCLAGCEIQETSEKKVKDLDFTVCDEGRLPEALVTLIMEKRKEPFRLTYKTKDYMYIVVGYGAQDRKDVGVTITDLYLTQNAIFVDTDLMVTDEVLENSMISYPWIAIKCELYDVQVVFQ